MMIIMIYYTTILSFLIIFIIGIISLYYTTIHENSHEISHIKFKVTLDFGFWILRFRPNLLTILSITSISTIITSIMTLYYSDRHTTIRTILLDFLGLSLPFPFLAFFHKLSFQFQHYNFCLFPFLYQ